MAPKKSLSDASFGDDNDDLYQNPDGVNAIDDDDDEDGDYGAEANTSKDGKKKRKSVANRKLMRWNADKDQLLLLQIEAVCAKRNITLPWDDIARATAPFLTGEAVKQHITKVYRTRVAHGFQVPVRHDKNTSAKDAKTEYDGIDSKAEAGTNSQLLHWVFPPGRGGKAGAFAEGADSQKSMKKEAGGDGYGVTPKKAGGGSGALVTPQKPFARSFSFSSTQATRGSSPTPESKSTGNRGRGRGKKAQSELSAARVEQDALPTPSKSTGKRGRGRKQENHRTPISPSGCIIPGSHGSSPSKKQKIGGVATDGLPRRAKAIVNYQEQLESDDEAPVASQPADEDESYGGQGDEMAKFQEMVKNNQASYLMDYGATAYDVQEKNALNRITAPMGYNVNVFAMPAAQSFDSRPAMQAPRHEDFPTLPASVTAVMNRPNGVTRDSMIGGNRLERSLSGNTLADENFGSGNTSSSSSGATLVNDWTDANGQPWEATHTGYSLNYTDDGSHVDAPCRLDANTGEVSYPVDQSYHSRYGSNAAQQANLNAHHNNSFGSNTTQQSSFNNGLTHSFGSTMAQQSNASLNDSFARQMSNFSTEAQSSIPHSDAETLPWSPSGQSYNNTVCPPFTHSNGFPNGLSCNPPGEGDLSSLHPHYMNYPPHVDNFQRGHNVTNQVQGMGQVPRFGNTDHSTGNVVNSNRLLHTSASAPGTTNNGGRASTTPGFPQTNYYTGAPFARSSPNTMMGAMSFNEDSEFDAFAQTTSTNASQSSQGTYDPSLNPFIHGLNWAEDGDGDLLWEGSSIV
ncbi:uncharacterized protein LTR77_007110 [Saxophila tyrrhenica]|uniref:Myb-like domain-containing protein n=1 Tax=Saxophila tyrrhenica TaxID=1690608 RepID=A0AAV9P3S8_9PEZI|nr:hypothetical protein LTR77_007110 [Saxophila tyrrhenica]